jgi:hypothetical protein
MEDILGGLNAGQVTQSEASSIADSLSDLVDSSMLQVRRGLQYEYCMLGFVREIVSCLPLP